MQNRRNFLRSAAVLTGAAFAHGSIPEAIARAAKINPHAGTTFLDAEHVVILMQENRSFDHCYGALQGVRGFRDPRAHIQPDGNPVWFQTDAKGDTYAPFKLDIKNTNATWLGGLPHGWTDQIDARNGGRYDRWLIAKPKRDLPLPFTLAHYGRADVPFYYAFADAFTVCDQAFCSSLTGTTANRLFLWSGNIRADAKDVARVSNADTVFDKEAAWGTYPDRLQDAGVSWRIYQNELTLGSGLTPEEGSWLSNYGDNPIEWFTQFNVRFRKTRREYIQRFPAEAAELIRTKEQQIQAADVTPDLRAKLNKEIDVLKSQVAEAEREHAAYHDAAWSALSPRAKALHENAFCTNDEDPNFRSLTTLSYQDGETRREARVPKGDIFHRFRQDVDKGTLPAVSWLVAPQNFSDHPSSAWYGAWYVSESLNILTKNPEVWKKTIFILCYDENDGYFDHVPPFVAPHPGRPETGKTSEGIDTTVDVANVYGRDHSIGLGYRVPLVVASPWSRGGCVNSQVFDHTSVIQLVETWLAGKGKHAKEPNISAWRRTVCGDLSSAFRPYDGEKIVLPKPLDRDETVEGIHSARFKQRPGAEIPLTKAAIAAANVGAAQEPGTRPSCPLPYDLHVNAEAKGDGLAVAMKAGATFGNRSQGSPFNGYSYGSEMTCRTYAVQPGHAVQDVWPIAGAYNVRIDGPNGFMREFKDGTDHTPLAIVVDYTSGKGSTGKIQVRVSNAGSKQHKVVVRDESYGAPDRSLTVRGNGSATAVVETAKNHGWYHFTVSAGDLAYRYAGRVETGNWSITDPAMGKA